MIKNAKTTYKLVVESVKFKLPTSLRINKINLKISIAKITLV